MQQCPSCDSATTYLEAEDVRRVVAQRFQLGDGALDHGRRPAAEDVGLRARKDRQQLRWPRPESSRAGADLKAIIAAFCAPLPAPLPIFSMVAGSTRLEETRLHSYDRSASRGDEGNSQRQFAC